ncbi:MAG: hypothetical protein QOI80_3371 [Solirubrobacteraceae bacterium]|jgi:uncharacterized protein with FMN-binding domain|nr:hypothetical protein [Solirubrobacteraceae bacterium]
MPLPRLLTTIIVTAATIALVLSFKNAPHVQKGRLATVRPGGAPAPTPRATASRRAARARRVTGASVMTQYGPVQVRVDLRGHRIESITALALPFDRSRSQEISDAAGPLLRQEALAAQSAQIDVVSGATYTSNGYAQSLQSALDQANG